MHRAVSGATAGAQSHNPTPRTPSDFPASSDTRHRTPKLLSSRAFRLAWRPLTRALSCKPDLHRPVYTSMHLPYNARVTSVEELAQGNWIQTRKINYTDASGAARVWEMAVRTTRTKTTGLDAVAILAWLRGAEKRLVLVKQFRPPCAAVVVELPAGLIDPNETVELTAARELAEETGYHGRVVRVLPAMYADPGLTNANMALVTMDVDMADERNRKPVPHLEDGEFIDVFTLPARGLLESLAAVCEAEGCVVDAKLYHLALGLELAQHA